jgi:hypothetical protein
MKKLGLLFVMVISLVFTVSCVSKEVPVTENYYETEYRTETYTTTEEYQIKTPHSTTIYQFDGYYNDLFVLLLFNKDSDGNIHWARVSPGTSFPDIKTFKPELKGQNNRISIEVTGLYGGNPLQVYLDSGRDSEATKLGFKPLPLPNITRDVFKRALPLVPNFWIDSLIAWDAFGYGDNNTIKSGVQVENIINYEIKMPDGTTEKYTTTEKSIEFLLDEMFLKEQWSLITIMWEGPTSMLWEGHNPEINMVTNYIWDDVSLNTREVTKYRELPEQVEKQRTVMQTKKVPFWEAIFH